MANGKRPVGNTAMANGGSRKSWDDRQGEAEVDEEGHGWKLVKRMRIKW